MSLINRFCLRLFVLLSVAWVMGLGCSTPPVPKPLTISEQIEVDTVKASEFIKEFQKSVHLHSYADGEKFLAKVAQALAKTEPEFLVSTLKVKITEDQTDEQAQLFAFPGTTLFMPLSLLKKIEYETELAAILAYELANVMNRHLAKKMESLKTPSLFGSESVFILNRNERAESIRLATRLLYYGGYDLRGMASVFQRYPEYFGPNGDTETDKKEVEFNIREAQQAKSEYLPSRGPIVRSAEFIKMKKGLGH